MKISNNPLIIELLPEFIDSFINDINENFDTYSTSKDEYYRFGHTLKGSSDQFEVLELSNLGDKIMKKAQENDFADVAEIKKEALNYLYELKKEFEKVNQNS